MRIEYGQNLGSSQQPLLVDNRSTRNFRTVRPRIEQKFTPQGRKGVKSDYERLEYLSLPINRFNVQDLFKQVCDSDGNSLNAL